MSTPRPLYRLPTLADAETVYVCEGEKPADAAIACGLVATTSAHGSQSASKTDWSPTADKHVVILVDRNDAGEKYGRDVAQLTLRAGALSAKIVRLWKRYPDIPDGGDIDDVVAAQLGQEDVIRAAVEALADEAELVVVEADDAEPGAHRLRDVIDAEDDERILLDPKYPTETVRVWIGAEYMTGGAATLRTHQDEAYRWRRVLYRKVSDHGLRRGAYMFADECRAVKTQPKAKADEGAPQ